MKVKRKAAQSPGTDLDAWDDAYYVRAADLARAGDSDARIAQVLGVSPVTFRKWKGKLPALASALAQARSTPPEPFADYVYKHLPPDLRDWWRQSMLADEMEKDEDTRAEAQEIQDRLIEEFGRMHLRTRQHLFVHAMVASLFNASEACRKTGVSYDRYKEWAADPAFKKVLDQVREHLKNFGQGALLKLVDQGIPSAVIFFNKTMNADRGFQVVKKVEGTVDHVHSHTVTLTDAVKNMSLADRKRILEQFRGKVDPKALPPHEDDVQDAEVV